MTKKQAVELYAVLRELNNGNMNRESLASFIVMRLKLKAVFDEFEKAKEDISIQTQPKGYKEGDDKKEWDSLFRLAIEKWLLEEITLIETKVISHDDFIDMMVGTQHPGRIQDFLYENLVNNNITKN